MAAHPNPKREAFCQQYLIDCNASQAAIRAGYAKKNARRIGWDIIQDPLVEARISELIAERNAAIGVSAERVVIELARIAFASIAPFVPRDEKGERHININDASDEELIALGEYRTESIERVVDHEPTEDEDKDETSGKPTPAKDKIIVTKKAIKMWDKNKALHDLAEHTGVFRESDERKANALATALDEIWIRGGSRAPIVNDNPEASA